MPVHRERLRTFTLTKTQKQQIKQVERDRWLQVNFLNHQISYVAKGGVDPTLLNSLYGPVSPVSKLLVDHHGLPSKASKSVTAGYLEKRYKYVPVFMANFPSQWILDVVILEVMFLIQTPPIPTMSCMRDYVNLLLTKSVYSHLKAGVTAVHVVFDNPGLLPEAPKEMEHRRRDNTTKDLSAHHCIHFSSEQCIFQVHGGQYLLSMQESPDTLPN